MISSLDNAFNENKIWQYRHYFLKFKTKLFWGVVMLLITNLLGAQVPKYIQYAIDEIARFESLDPVIKASVNVDGTLNNFLWMIILLALGMFVSRVFSRIWILSAGARVEYDMRTDLFKHLMTMSPSFYARHPTGEVMSRMTNDLESARMMVGGGIMLGFNTLFVYVTCIPLMIELSPKLTLLAFILYPVSVWGATKLSTHVKKLYYGVQDILGDISASVQENFAGMAVIQAFATESEENLRIQEASDLYFNQYQRLIRMRMLMMMVFLMLGGASYLIVLAFGGRQVIYDEMTLGGFIAFTLFLERITWPTASMGWTLSTIQQGQAALQRIDDVLSESPDITNVSDPEQLPKEVAGKIELKNLTFQYSSSPSIYDNLAPALQDINLSIEAGESIALVGPVGCGKTTLLRLLPRLYNTPEGTVFLDGLDVTQLNLDDVRKTMVLMPQQSFLFSTMVSHNVAFGDLEAMQDIEKHIVPATKMAHVHDEVMGLKHEYSTLVGERGVLLSGGQRQRVAFARALMLDAPVLLLDDPFASVDAETEEAIVETFHQRQLLKNKTTLFATHRFSLVRQATRVVLMSGGKIEAVDTHENLLKQSELYQRLNRLDALQRQVEGGSFD